MARDLFAPTAGLDVSEPVAGADLFARDPNAPGPFARGVRTGVAGVKAAARGVQAIGARAIGAQAAEAEALQAAQDTLQATAPDQMRVEDVASVGGAFDFTKYALGTALPSILAMVAGGTLGRGVSALLAKRIAAQGTRALVKEAGLVGGAGLTSVGMEAGSIFPDAVEQKVEDPALRAVAGGIAAGALDILPGYAAARRLGLVGDAALNAPRKAGTGAVLKGAGKDALTGLALESTTEAAQSAIERVAAGQDLTSPEAMSDYLNSAAIGAVAGGTIGGAVGGVRAFQQPVQEPAPSTSAVQAPIVNAAPAEPPLPILTPTEGALPDIRDFGVPPVVDAVPPPPGNGPSPGGAPAGPAYRRASAPVAADADFATLEALRGQQEALAARKLALDAEFQLPEGKRRVKGAIANESRAVNAQLTGLNTQIDTLTQQIRNRFASELAADSIAQAPERTPPAEPVFPESGAFKRPPVEDTAAAELTVARQKQSVGALVSKREAQLLREAEKAAPKQAAVVPVTENTPRERYKTATPERRAEVIEGVATESIARHAKELSAGFRKGTEAAAVESLKRVAQVAAKAPTIEAAEKAVYDAAIRALAGKVNKADAETFAQAVAADVRSAPTFYSKAAVHPATDLTRAEALVPTTDAGWIKEFNKLNPKDRSFSDADKIAIAKEDRAYRANERALAAKKRYYAWAAQPAIKDLVDVGVDMENAAPAAPDDTAEFWQAALSSGKSAVEFRAEERGIKLPPEALQSHAALAVTKISDLLAYVPQVARTHALNDGSSTNLVTGQDLGGTDNYAVSIYKDRELKLEGQPTEQQIRAYVETNADLLADSNNMLGTWYNPEDGYTYIDVSMVTPTMGEALRLGREHQQLAVFDLRTFTNIELGHPLFDSAQEYNAAAGMTPVGGLTYKPLDTALGIRAAKAFDAIPRESTDPVVQSSYAAMVQESELQYDYASRVIKIEPWAQDGQPYANSHAMRKDVFENKHLYVFQGGDPHPLITPEQIYKIRAVHDLYGHAQTGFEFGPRGEQNAARAHAQMYSEAAIPAHMTEFFGFTSWNMFSDVNLGKKPADITYASNRVGLMPEAIWRELLAEPLALKQSALDRHDAIFTDKGQRLVAHLKGMIGEDPNLEVRLFQAEPGDPIGGYTRTDTLKSVISLALNAKGDLSIADHEGFHYLEDKVLDGRERIVIARQLRPGAPLFVKLLESVQRYDTENKTNLVDEILSHPAEARAYGYEFWRRGELQADGILSAIFEKIRQFLERVVNFTHGLGFTSIQDIFQSIERGQYAQRGELSRVTEADTDWAADVEPDVLPGLRTLHKKDGAASAAKGRPYWIKAGADVARLRARLKQLALEGESGRQWHAKSAEAILTWAKGDKALAAQMAALIANFSPRTPVGLDLKKAFTAFVQFEAKQPLAPGAPQEHTLGARRILTGLEKDGSPAPRDEAGNVRPTGIKRENFFKNLMLGIDPKHYNVSTQGATIDMWMSHAFDYANDVMGSVTKSQYNYADAEVKRLAKELGWSVEETQAAIWIATKARGNSSRSLMERHALNRGWYESVPDKSAPVESQLFGTEAVGLKRAVKADKQRAFVTEWMRMSRINPISQEQLARANYDYAQAFEDIYSGKIDLSARLDELPYQITKPAAQDEYELTRQPTLFSRAAIAETPKQTDTPAFKAWFGDSKVVDDQGKPLVVYHGTAESFDTFSMEGRSYLNGLRTRGAAWFTPSPRDAAWSAEHLPKMRGESGGAQSLVPVYLSLKNPLVVPHYTAYPTNADIAKLSTTGHDGVIVSSTGRVSDATKIMVLRPEQIKSATGNRGTFSPDSPNILFSKAAVADMDRQIKHGELEREQGFNTALGIMDAAKLSLPSLKTIFGAVGEEMTGGVARWMMSHVTTQNYISRFSAGFRNVYQALSAYTRYKALLISEGSRVQLSKWNTAAQDDITATFDALLKRTIGGYLAGSTEYNLLRSELRPQQREMFDQASTMIAGFLNRELAADEKTFKQLLNPGEYAAWDAHRTEQVRGLIAGGYIPERRHGDFTVTIYQDVMDDKGVPHRVAISHEQFEHEAAANIREEQYAAEIKKQGLPLAVVRGTRHKTARDTEVSIQQFLDTARRNGVVITQLERERLAKSLTAADSMRRNRLMHRENVPGMSRDGTRVLNEFVVTMANKIAYSEFAPAINAAASGSPVDARTEANIPKIDINPTRNLWDEDGSHSGFYRNKADELTDYVLVPDHTGAWSKNLRGAAMGYFLGGSLAGAAVNTMSIPMLTVPALSQHTTYNDAFTTTFGAWKDTWLNQGALRDITRLKDKDAHPMPTIDAVPGLRAALITAAEDGRTMDTEIHQIMGLSQGQILSKSRNVQRAVNLWMAPFKVAEQTNRITTFIAAYKVGQKNHLSGRALYEFAAGMVDATQNRYDEVNRPAAARNPIWAIMFMFKSFPIFMTEAVALMYKQNPKSAVYMLLGLTMMAGVQGLPFAEDILDLIDTISQKIFGSPFNARRAIRNVVKDASEALVGADLSEVVLRGVVNSVTGMNVASRVGMGDMLPGTRIGAADGDYARTAQQLLGAPVAMVADLAKGGATLAGGVFGHDDFVSAVGDALKQSGPSAVRNLAKGLEQADRGYATDAKGRKLVDVSGPEAFWQSLGFTSAGLNQAYEMDKIDRQTTAFYTQVRSGFTEQLTKALLAGDSAKAQETMDAVQAWNTHYPDMPISFNASTMRRHIVEAGLPLNERTMRLMPKQLRGTSIAREAGTGQ